MSKTERYLKMRTPADLLTVRYFSSSGQLKGGTAPTGMKGWLEEALGDGAGI